MAQNGHENNSNMILKMDVESAEWDFPENVSSDTLNKFDQMVFEFHNFTDPKTEKEMDRIIGLLEKITATHTLVHFNGNNFYRYVYINDIGIIPNVLELTYLHNEKYTFCDDAAVLLPRTLDIPNEVRLSDIPLGYWNKWQGFF